MSESLQKVAVIGGGVAGVVSAYLLDAKYQVTLFEMNPQIGGHTNTVVLEDGLDAGLGIDTGFIVLNDKTYPLFHRFLKRLDVAVRLSDMSFSYHCEHTGFQYAGTTLNGLFAQRRNIFSPKFWTLLAGIGGFCRDARAKLKQGALGNETLGEFLAAGEYSPILAEQYLLPMGGAIWSSPREEMLEFPVKSFIHFFENHGLLSFFDRPNWQTVTGGSHSYLKRFLEVFGGTVRTSCNVQGVSRDELGVDIAVDGELERFDSVIIATHADQALALLDDAGTEEQRLLSAWGYSRNKTILHTDHTVLPPLERAWASWNYARARGGKERDPVSVTYYMNLLQGIASKTHYCVTLNHPREIHAEHIICEIDYTHPIFTTAAIATQDRLPSLNGKNRTYFCGSYFGYGFHEDAVRSAVSVGKQFGAEL